MKHLVKAVIILVLAVCIYSIPPLIIMSMIGTNATHVFLLLVLAEVVLTWKK